MVSIAEISHVGSEGSRKSSFWTKNTMPNHEINNNTTKEPLKDEFILNEEIPNTLKDTDSDGNEVDYARFELLGSGGFAKVYRVRDLSDGSEYADKIIRLDKINDKKRKDVQREIEIHHRMDHVNVVKFIKFFHDDDLAHIILEYCSLGTLMDVQKNRTTITEPEVRYYLKQIMEGTRHINLRGIVHCDLKLSNFFLFSDMTLKIGDFGLAFKLSDQQRSKVVGTPNYLAPEIFADKKHNFSTEIWAIGCSMYSLLFGKPPFDSQTLSLTCKRIKSIDYKFPMDKPISEEARDMMVMMLNRDPDARGHLAMPDDGNHPGEDLFLHPFLAAFTPETLPVSAIRSEPYFSDQTAYKYHSTSSAISIVNRRQQNLENAGEISRSSDLNGLCFSPKFSPCRKHGSSLKQKLVGCFEKRSNFLRNILMYVDKFLDSEPLQDNSKHQPPPVGLIPVFVTKWVDYTHIYGFGYQLSNNVVGLLFKDGTKMNCSKDGSRVEFQDLKGKWFDFRLKGPIPFDSDNLRSNLAIFKKVIKYMDNKLHNTHLELKDIPVAQCTQKSIFMKNKRYYDNGSVLLMELNNHTIQVNHLLKHFKVILFKSGKIPHITIFDSRDKELGYVTYSLDSLISHGCPHNIHFWLQLLVPVLRLFEAEE